MTGRAQPLTNSLQVDAAFQFRLRSLYQWWVRPAPVRALLGIRIVHVAAGCLHSVAFSQDGALFAWGAALQAGVAEVSGPEAAWIPRLLAPSPKMPLVRVGTVAAGGWHSLVTATPSCPMEKLLPAYGEDPGVEAFCDGYIVSDLDSRPGEEARVYLSCAAVRARLALPDGTDSPVWRTFSAQVLRLQEDLGRFDSLLEEQEEDEEEDCTDSDADGLMGIVAMHRQHPRARSRADLGARSLAQPPPAPLQGPGQTSDADEAAGKALQPVPAAIKPVQDIKEIKKMPLPKPPPKPRPIFSSDSSGSDAEPLPRPSRGKAGTTARPLPRQLPPGQPQPVAIFSSDSSSSDESPLPRAKRLTLPTHRQAPQLASTARDSFVELSKFSEAVLAAFVRFLNTDSLGALEVIDEAHPLWQREQHLRLRPPGLHPADDSGGEASSERPTSLRASKGLLLAREVADLRKLGDALGLERLACLCDQLLLRLDAPGAPALFVPASALRTAMWTLFQQTLEPPLRDGPDTRILCGPPVKRRARWGPRTMPGHGKLWGHAFVLCASCGGILLDSGQEASGSDARQSQPSGLEWTGGCCLKRRNLGAAVYFELDLLDVPADVAFAWLRYLYTQDDLSLLWPCRGRDREESVAAEGFWTELLRLAQRLGDRKLLLYAQDALVGALSLENWTHMAIFAEQVQCPVLSEAALMVGVRSLSPTLLASFRVPTGLERDDADRGGDKGEALSGPAEQSATVASGPGRPGGACGSVDLELERRLLEPRAGAPGAEQAAVLTLKKGSPAQYAELKHRLADNITSAQRTAEQLQRCVQFFDSHERRGFRRDDKHGRALWMELAVLAGILMFLLTPSAARQMTADALAALLDPLRISLSIFEVSWLAPLSSGVFRVVAVNIFMFLVLCGVIWHNLNK
mmetsp:Transcript_112061/g.357669  ORF Transcript_112061/g.357669 Transcript_112061/m.357669 type:complete len:914 (+) Transcript_112061:2-2743(+)